MANEQLLYGFLLWGFLLGKIIPLKITAWRKWWYNRRGIAYFSIYMLQAGKLIHKGMVKQINKEFSFDKGRYLTYKKDPISGVSSSPSIDIDGEDSIFYQTNNTDPLEFQETRIIPSHNDPKIFQTIIEDNSIAQALSGEIDISALKRYILITMGIMGLAIAGLMWFLTKM